MEYKYLKDLAEIKMGQSPDSSSYNNEKKGLPFFQGNADFGELYPISRVWCNSPKKIAEPGDILISVRAPIGALNYANTQCCIGRGLAAISIIDETERKYIYYLLKAKNKELNNSGTGSTFKAISKNVLEDLQIPQISRLEQQKCMNLIDSLETIIRKRKKQLSQFDTLIKARFVEMFGDPEINQKGWNECSLSEKLNVVGGYAFKSDQFDEESGVPVLRIGNINAGFFRPVNLVYWQEDDSLEKYVMYPGDLVMSLTGTVGKDDYGNVCILGDEYDKYYLNQRNAKLEIKGGIDKYYLSQLLKFEQIKKRLTGISRGVRQANISNKDILNLVVPVPPMELQNKFSDFIKQVDKSKFAIQKALDKAQLLFDSLMQKYFG